MNDTQMVQRKCVICKLAPVSDGAFCEQCIETLRPKETEVKTPIYPWAPLNSAA